MMPIKCFLILGLFVSCLTKNLNAQQPKNSNQSLDMKHQSIVTISAFTAKGDLVQLEKTLSDGLDAGLTVILGVICPPGDQEYVPPPVEGVAVSVALCPTQIVVELTDTVGAGVTITSILALGLSHPATV